MNTFAFVKSDFIDKLKFALHHFVGKFLLMELEIIIY